MPVKPDKLQNLFQRNLRARRQELGLTQTQLAKLIGAQQPYVADLENGERHPTIKTIAKLSEALKVPPDFFLSPQLEKISA
jgi:transcriptional regulator with XRE-family HTH domain